MLDNVIGVFTLFPHHPAESRLVPLRSDKNPQRNLDLLHRDDSLALNYDAPCRTRKRSPSLEVPHDVPPSFVDSILQARRFGFPSSGTTETPSESRVQASELTHGKLGTS